MSSRWREESHRVIAAYEIFPVIAMEVDAQSLHQLAASDDLRRLRHTAAGPDVLAKLGSAVANANGEIADVAVDEQTAMARDAFRRFAADVVAPMAEKIHRHDLTVPESLLQPMREMGVFGLSIPEMYGGSHGASEDFESMLIVTEELSAKIGIPPGHTDPSGTFTLTRLRQTFTPIRYSHVLNFASAR